MLKFKRLPNAILLILKCYFIDLNMFESLAISRNLMKILPISQKCMSSLPKIEYSQFMYQGTEHTFTYSLDSL